MDWFCATTDRILHRDNVNPDEPFQPVLAQLKEKILALYTAILLYQMKSVCYYFRHPSFNFVLQLAKWDDWDGALDGVKRAEIQLKVDFDLHIKANANEYLKNLSESADKMRANLGNIDQTLEMFIDFQMKWHQGDKNLQCLRQLCVVNPRDDMTSIETEKEKPLKVVYEWFLSSKEFDAFTGWGGFGPSSCRLLSVVGKPGTGKTMLMMGIIRELANRPATLAPSLAYFFLQGTGTKRLNTAAATLRSLIWMLLVQQPGLIPHLQSESENSKVFFTDDNVFYALSKVFENMLKDPLLSPVYLIIDALDECDETVPGVNELIELI